VFHDVGPARSIISCGRYAPTQLLLPDRLKDGSGRWSCNAGDLGDGFLVYRLGPQDMDSSLKSKDPPFFHHASTVHTAIHFAAFLGASSVTLYGCDAKFAPDGRSHTKIINNYRGGYYWSKNKDTENYLRRIGRGYDMLREAFGRWNITLLKLEYV
jgi:hypothetical protein